VKILCCTYRDWANKIYHSLEQKFTDKTFIKINSMDFDYGHIETIKPDLILWYGWSKIIPNTLLKKYYSVMLHPSPLPLYRGGSPIQNQIINGEEVSAVTLFKMNEGIDTGDIISQVPLSLKGDLEEIFARITDLGTNQTRKMILDFPNLKLKKQNNCISSLFKRRTPSQSEITFEELSRSNAKDIYNKIRALQDPYPNAFLRFKDGSKLYLTKSHYEK
jgi:methionyl-tRNA formyltransferase